MSENERQSQTNAVINDKLQSTVLTHLRCGVIFNNHIKKGMLLSLPVKKFSNRRIFGIGTGKLVDCVVHFLRLFNMVWWPGAQSARDNYHLACNFGKYSQISKFPIFTGRQ